MLIFIQLFIIKREIFSRSNFRNTIHINSHIKRNIVHKRKENEIKEIENYTATFAVLNTLHRVSFHLNCTRFFGTCHKKNGII